MKRGDLKLHVIYLAVSVAVIASILLIWPRGTSSQPYQPSQTTQWTTINQKLDRILAQLSQIQSKLDYVSQNVRRELR